MARSNLRLPYVYKYFRDNAQQFAAYVGLPVVSDEFKNTREYFIDHYEELLVYHSLNPDLRLGQLLSVRGVVANFYKEEVQFLLEGKLMRPEFLLTWGSTGIDGEERKAAWHAKEPKLNDKLTEVETWLWGDLKNYERYARRWSVWQDQKPLPEFKLLKDLDEEHMRNILRTQTKISDIYRTTFKRLLGEDPS